MKKYFRNFLIILLLGTASLYAEVYKKNAVASYYGKGFDGKKTSSGEIFNSNDFTCANKSLPFDTILKVTNLANNKSVKVRVNDRGPFVVGREIDLSTAAAIQLDMIKTGTANVKIEIIEMGPDTKLSQVTAESAAKIMAKKTGSTAEENTSTSKNDDSSKKTYVFQMGAFSTKANAKTFASKLSKDGFSNIAFQTNSKGVVRVVIKDVKENQVDELTKKLNKKGYKDFQVKEQSK